MTTLEQQAAEYAEQKISLIKALIEKPNSLRSVIKAAMSDAYAQGWIDCDTACVNFNCENRTPKYVLAEDCAYYDQAMCRKGLPGITGCNRIGCAAYYPKKGEKQ